MSDVCQCGAARWFGGRRRSMQFLPERGVDDPLEHHAEAVAVGGRRTPPTGSASTSTPVRAGSSADQSTVPGSRTSDISGRAGSGELRGVADLEARRLDRRQLREEAGP